MSGIQFHVVIDPAAPTGADVVYFQAGVAPVEGLAVYETVEGFHRDLVSGRPLPLVFWTPRISDDGALLALALFLHRDLAIHPGTIPLLAARAFLNDFPVWGGAHIDRDLGRFLGFLKGFVPPGLSRQELSDRVPMAVGWIHDYITKGELPQMADGFQGLRVIDRGSNGFVLAESLGQDLEAGWLELFRQGHLRGLLMGPLVGRSRKMLIARKTEWAPLNLEVAGSALNELEVAMGGDPEWAVGGDWLRSPGGGSLLSVSHVFTILSRV